MTMDYIILEQGDDIIIVEPSNEGIDYDLRKLSIAFPEYKIYTKEGTECPNCGHNTYILGDCMNMNCGAGYVN